MQKAVLTLGPGMIDVCSAKTLTAGETSEHSSQSLIDCEGYERIAKRSDPVAVAAGCNDDVLPSV
jgi:hypothetical protein